MWNTNSKVLFGFVFVFLPSNAHWSCKTCSSGAWQLLWVKWKSSGLWQDTFIKWLYISLLHANFPQNWSYYFETNKQEAFGKSKGTFSNRNKFLLCDLGEDIIYPALPLPPARASVFKNPTLCYWDKTLVYKTQDFKVKDWFGLLIIHLTFVFQGCDYFTDGKNNHPYYYSWNLNSHDKYLKSYISEDCFGLMTSFRLNLYFKNFKILCTITLRSH